MPAFISVALGGAAALVSGHLLTKTPKAKLGEVLIKNKKPESLLTSTTNQLVTTLKPPLVKADNRYQWLVQTYLDPLLGRKRQDYLNILAIDNQSELTISRPERVANQRLGIGGLALVASGLGYLISPVFTPIAIGFGLISATYVYEFGYYQWKRTRKLGSIHLIGMYLAFLWLGGYATIGALGVVFISVGTKIKAITEDQSRNNLLNLFQIQPDKVWVRHADGMEITIPFDQLQVGDIIILQAGQTVPVDGVIVTGEATIDQHMLTGESQPVEKTTNEPVLASTLVLSGKIDVRVEKAGSETTAGQIVHLLNNASRYNNDQALKALMMADQLAWPTLIGSIVSWPFLGTAGAASLLGSNLTTIIQITSPLAMLNYFNMAAEKGVLIKDGAGLERISEIDTIVFDKTGTLTLEELQVAKLHPMPDTTPNQLLSLAATAESRQSHPIAQAILKKAEQEQLELPPLEQAHYEMGYGLKVKLSKGEIRVGSQRFMTMEGIPVPAFVDDLNDQCQATGHSLVMVALNDQLIGCIELQPLLRPETEQVVTKLRQRGLSLYIISGDQETPTRKIADHLGMTGYFANTLPEQKADLVAGLQEEGRTVCFVGDGINDTLAMRKADVSISLRGATSVATDTAQIILMDGNLTQLPYLVKIGQSFEQNVKTNFNYSVFTSLCTIGTILTTGLAFGASPFFASFAFGTTQFFFVSTLGGGLWIAMNPKLEHKSRPLLTKSKLYQLLSQSNQRSL